MTDEALRALERRWAETGADEDEAAVLRERSRLARLPAPQLELAAHLGHPAAVLVLGARPPLTRDIGELMRSIQKIGGSSACMQTLRLALAATRADSPEVAAALELADRWLAARPDDREALEDEARRSLPGHDAVHAVPPTPTLLAALAPLPAPNAAALALQIAVAMPWGEESDRARHLVSWCSQALALVTDAVAGPGRMPGNLRRPVPGELLGQIRDGLIAWTLAPTPS